MQSWRNESALNQIRDSAGRTARGNSTMATLVLRISPDGLFLGLSQFKKL